MAGPKGNSNGRKHNIYSAHISREESALINAFPAGYVDNEIAYQRAVIGRLAAVLENNGLAYGSRDALSDDTRATVKLLNETLRGLLAYIRRHSSAAADAQAYKGELDAGKHLARLEKNVFKYLEAPRSRR